MYYGTLDVELNGQVVLGYVVDGNTYPISYEIVEVTQDTIILYACNECGFFSDYGKGSEYLIFKMYIKICYNILLSTVYIIVLTRLQYPSCETTEAAITFVVNLGIERNYIIMHDQNDCENCKLM